MHQHLLRYVPYLPLSHVEDHTTLSALCQLDGPRTKLTIYQQTLRMGARRWRGVRSVAGCMSRLSESGFVIPDNAGQWSPNEIIIVEYADRYVDPELLPILF